MLLKYISRSQLSMVRILNHNSRRFISSNHNIKILPSLQVLLRRMLTHPNRQFLVDHLHSNGAVLRIIHKIRNSIVEEVVVDVVVVIKVIEALMPH